MLLTLRTSTRCEAFWAHIDLIGVAGRIMDRSGPTLLFLRAFPSPIICVPPVIKRIHSRSFDLRTPGSKLCAVDLPWVVFPLLFLFLFTYFCVGLFSKGFSLLRPQLFRSNMSGTKHDSSMTGLSWHSPICAQADTTDQPPVSPGQLGTGSLAYAFMESPSFMAGLYGDIRWFGLNPP